MTSTWYLMSLTPLAIQSRVEVSSALDPGEVLVPVKAAAADPMDWKIRNGEMKS